MVTTEFYCEQLTIPACQDNSRSTLFDSSGYTSYEDVRKYYLLGGHGGQGCRWCMEGYTRVNVEPAFRMC